MSSLKTDRVSAIVLAGGRARRMGGADKGWLDLAGRPLVARVLDRLAGQAGEVIISANRHLERYAALGWPVVPDPADDFPGPLAGIAAAGREAQGEWLLVVPCDTPFLPEDLAPRMLAEARTQDTRLVRAADHQQTHYAIMLFRRELLPDLADYLASGERRVQSWQARHHPADVVFTDPPHAFMNLNSPEDVSRAERWLTA